MPDQDSLFAQLIVRHYPALMRYVMTFVPRRNDAEDVLQQAATVLWEKFPEYDRSREFLPWAIRITYFEILNFRKHAARSRVIFRQEVVDALVDMRQLQEPVLEGVRDALQECLQRIDSDGQALLRKRYCDAQTIASLAKTWGKATKSVSRRLNHLRMQLARCVERRLAGENFTT